MNKSLLLKGSLSPKSHPGGGGGRQFPKDAFPLSTEKIKKLKDELESIYSFWENDTLLGTKKIVTVYYDRIVAKSNRIHGIFNIKNDTVIGVRFSETQNSKHIITYGLTLEEIRKAIERLNSCLTICEKKAWKNINNLILDKVRNKEVFLDSNLISKSSFLDCCVDSFYIERIDISQEVEKHDKKSVITLYDTGVSSKSILSKLGINYIGPRSIDENTFLLTPEQYAIIEQKAPYLVAMAVTDLQELDTDDVLSDYISDRTIPAPKDEPIIGVIDTQFNNQVYFAEWVDYKNVVDPNLTPDYRDYFHGTFVSSIIVDGPSLNPDLDDGCGRFRVKHFGVSINGRFSSYFIMSKIEELVIANPEIKVWNLSLGSPEEIRRSFISPEAYVLDRLQAKYDVIFVVAGTNKIKTDSSAPKKIGAPADSINSIVVNSVTRKGIPASYSRQGPVLSFYHKPDFSYYGGDLNQNDSITVYGDGGTVLNDGTSFAAPWIARKLAYLIYKMGLNRETAKAMLIDSTLTWESNNTDINLIGYGIVPIRIEDIVNTKDDEIKFVINGVSENYMTYNYSIPVPFENDYFPFIAKTTMCYFTPCSRNQGVDYTNIELSFGFGSINNKQKLNKIKTKEKAKEKLAVSEKEARKELRKWDNVKFERQVFTSRQKGKKKTSSNYWGLEIISNERIPKIPRTKINFAVVVTLKELHGKNRYDEFKAKCQMSNWFVNEIDIDNRIAVYNQAEAEIEFED